MNKPKIVSATLAVIILFSMSACGKQENVIHTMNEVEDTCTTISITALGDNLMHMPVVNSGKKPDGSYDYSQIFRLLQPEIKESDIAVIGQETVFGGAEFGYTGYPSFNSPEDVGVSLANQGFDVVLHASNHVLDKGTKGVENTLNFWKKYPKISVLGIHDSFDSQNKVTIREVKGVKIALLNYTYGTNGINLPNEKSYLVDYIDTSKMEKDIALARENSDFIICFMHWGTEYSSKPDDMQKSLCKKMCEWGVDLVIGAHPHVIQPVEWIKSDNENEMLVFYSLGNFVSRQLEVKNLLGGMAEVTLKYDGNSVSISDYSFVPIVTHYNTEYNVFTVYPLSEYTDDVAIGHGVAYHDGGVSVERFEKYLYDTFEGYDLSHIKHPNHSDAFL